MKRLGGVIGIALLGMLSGAILRAEEWRIRVVGNLSFGKEWTPILRDEGADYPFRRIGDFLGETDLTIGFLDGTLSDFGEPMPWARSPMRSTPEVAFALKKGGFNAVCLASPHVVDFGADALVATQATLEGQGIASFGAGLNDTLSRMYALLTVRELRVACLGYLHGVQPGHASEEGAGANPALGSFIRDDVSNARQNAEVALVFFHWGETPGDEVDSKQRQLAQMAIESGATAVFGLRAQTWQGAEVYQGKPICYSLSDFIAGTGAKRFGRILVPTLVLDGASPVRVEFTPVRVDAALDPRDDPALRLQPRLLTSDEAREPIETFDALCRTLGARLVRSETGVVLPLVEVGTNDRATR